MARVAVIGGGISGLVCARRLAEAGREVTVFEKSRGVGGRMATRRTPIGASFDHGAQYFTARDERFQRQVQRWVESGVVAPWEGKVVAVTGNQIEEGRGSTVRYVGVPSMNAPCKDLARGLNVQLQTRVAPLSTHSQRPGAPWLLANDEGLTLGEFDTVVISAPAGQTAELTAGIDAVNSKADAVAMSGCWAVMLATRQSLKIPYEAAFINESILSWIARNDSKPGRGGDYECWVLHGSPEWSESNIDLTVDDALATLLDEFYRITDQRPLDLEYATAHRWRFAIPPDPHADHFLLDADRRVAACGDWCNGPRVEGAYLSGLILADRLIS